MTEYIVRMPPDMPYEIRAELNAWYVESEPIVRCSDCKYYRFKDRSHIFKDDRHNDSYCLKFVDGKRMEVEPDGFCAWGERKRKEVDE